MNNFNVPPEYCVIIKALRETHSLREAALALQTDAAHLSRKLQKISEEFDFIYKLSNKWVLTDQGHKLAQWVDESIVRQQELLAERPILKIAGFSWLAEELLIPGYLRLKELTLNKYSWRFMMTASNLELELISGRADFVITCHAPHDPAIGHKVFNPDPWVIVVPFSWSKELKRLSNEEVLSFLHTRPYLRLSTLTPEDTLGFRPKLISEFMVDGVIGIRAGVKNALGWSCLPRYSLSSGLENNELYPVNLETVTKGQLSIWWLRSRRDSLTQIKFLSKWLKEISDQNSKPAFKAR